MSWGKAAEHRQLERFAITTPWSDADKAQYLRVRPRGFDTTFAEFHRPAGMAWSDWQDLIRGIARVCEPTKHRRKK